MIQKGIPILITTKNLLDYISQEEIAGKYISGFNRIGEPFKSEFRREKEPSSIVFWGNYGDLMFKDFGDPNLPKALNLIEYVQYKYNLKYQEAVNKIGKDFNLLTGKDSSFSIINNGVMKKKIKREHKTPSNLIIKIKKRDWTSFDIDYWNSYYIPIKMLERNNIKSISHVFYNHYPPIEFTKTHLVYSYDYYWSNNIFRRKIYQPYSQTMKWRTNTDYTVVQNYPNIPKTGGKLLFIQSSYKDCMVMERLGYYAIAPNKEGSWIPDYYWTKIKERWKQIILFWNNDWNKSINPGLIYSQNFSEEYNIPFILIPDNEPVDISDYVKMYGLKKGKFLVEELINKI